MRRVIFLMTGLMILILSGCSNYEIPAPECPVGETDVSYSGDIQPIFNNKCISCHSGNQAPDLSDGWSLEELVDGGYLAEPEFACESSLYQVFSGTHAGRLTDEELMQILGWIQEGAQDN